MARGATEFAGSPRNRSMAALSSPKQKTSAGGGFGKSATSGARI